MDPDPYDFRDVIRERIETVSPRTRGRRPKGQMSYATLSRMCGLSKNAVSRFLRGDTALRIEKIVKLCCILDLQLVPGEFLPRERSDSPVYRKRNTVLNAKLRERAT